MIVVKFIAFLHFFAALASTVAAVVLANIKDVPITPDTDPKVYAGAAIALTVVGFVVLILDKKETSN